MFRLRHLLLFAFATPAWAADPLPAVGADVSQITVSGISSGGYMSVQFHVAHSSRVSGAGIVAGGPYECAQGSASRALSNCMAPDGNDPVPDTATSLGRVNEDAAAGRIDAPTGLSGDRVWLLSGGADRTVERPVVDALAAFYRTWISADALAYVKLPGAGHAMISADDPQANACNTSEPPFINRCETAEPPGTLFDAPGQLLNHLLGPLQAKAAEARGELISFDQIPFTDAADALGMSQTGYAYVPTGCRGQQCKVHVAFHGCRQSADQIGTTYVTEAGYNRWAESNRIIVLYPQTTPRYGWTWSGWWPRWVFNPKACWDWWGYEDADYATAKGVQIKAVMGMIEQLGQPAP
ncbi:extracellular catalytic domain type 2 short-chain-length polyhydroxyalkanoate depolymerase [Nitrogeniibacter aestuarii]|uniref:extracellular catalytic domain type 2 short-chain-length polyhydroxyalkanoate depolymerase n=1 Tax=Nitrogeniibacter aestuarii TaxID=2815343 RepID=UPI001E29C6CC|nr:poly(3-hydroxybutyrate) depolymerase [Nitrogeniibacter aestuarii]